MIMESNTVSAALKPIRLSRYRSVRKAAKEEQHSTPPLPPPASVPGPASSPDTLPQNDQIKRAPSRYRRPSKPTVQDVALSTSEGVDNFVPVRAQVVREAEAETEAEAEAEDKDMPGSPRQRSEAQLSTQTMPSSTDRYHRHSGPPQYPGTHDVRQRSTTVAATGTQSYSIPKSFDEVRAQVRMILESEQDRMRRLKEQEQQVERERMATLRQEPLLQAPTEKTQSGARTNLKSEENKTKSSRQWIIGRMNHSRNIFGASRNVSPERAEETSSKPSKEGQGACHSSLEGALLSSHAGHPTSESTNSSQACSDERQPVFPMAPNTHVLQPSPLIYENLTTRAGSPPKANDVPVSAINSGERRVELRFGSTCIVLPVVPSTTTLDLLNSASLILLQPIDPKTSILVEVYGPLNLERPLRRYEHIRDVLNSWDNDAQNHLNIMLESECAATGLDQAEAPSKQPGKTVVHLYHSQRPGKWEKQCLTLKGDGQVTISKDRHDENTKNIFHLSDFDIHMPTGKQKKKLKPPKKYCFAIKSQQRSVVFEKTTNFVHFFSTSDKSVADCWYHAVQAWRSWYLVNRMADVGKPPQLQLNLDHSHSTPQRGSPSTPKSIETITRRLETSKPMIDFSVDAFRIEDIKLSPPRPPRTRDIHPSQRVNPLKERTRNKLGRDMRTSRYHAPSFDHAPRPLIHTVRNKHGNFQNRPNVGDAEAGFTGKGLLGRHSSLSVKRMQSMEGTDDGFTGRGLIARSMSTKRFTNDAHILPPNMDDAFTGSGLVSRSVTKKRSQVSRPGQPLVDLSTRSDFVNGSLLRQVESFDISQRTHLRAIDRSRRIEIMDRTGEF